MQKERYIINLEKAKKSLQTADHLTYMTYPIVKENKLLLKVLEQINFSVLQIINAILQYEYTYKRIQIYTNPQENFKTFKKISEKYKINEKQLQTIIEILTLSKNHKKSPFEFSKNNKIVIMSDNLKTSTLNLEKIKQFVLEAKDLFRKVDNKIRKV